MCVCVSVGMKPDFMWNHIITDWGYLLDIYISYSLSPIHMATAGCACLLSLNHIYTPPSTWFIPNTLYSLHLSMGFPYWTHGNLRDWGVFCYPLMLWIHTLSLTMFIWLPTSRFGDFILLWWVYGHYMWCMKDCGLSVNQHFCSNILFMLGNATK